MSETVETIVNGGKANAGPPLGPSLSQIGMNVQEVVAAINEKTKSFDGMDVPVKVIIDTDTKEFEIEVGSPPTSALLKKEMGVKNMKIVKEGESTEGGDISFEKVVAVAKSKGETIMANNLANSVKQVLGTCLSGGVTVDGKSPRELQKEIDEGKLKVE